MQNKLQELTDKLYNEGLSKGKQEGEEILAKAKVQAEEIIAKAKAEAEAKLNENLEANAKWLAEVEQMEGVKKTESGLLYRIDRVGNGAHPTKDRDVVLVHYVGKNCHGEVFDSSYQRGESISFPLDGVIKGWTEGMKYVRAGGQITLWIPAELAYGDQQRGELIPPGSALEFKVELIEVNPREE